jgi:hypothetical protein
MPRSGHDRHGLPIGAPHDTAFAAAAPRGRTERFSFDPGVMSMALQDGVLEHMQLHGQEVASGDIVVFPEGGELLALLPPRSHWLSLQLPRRQLEAAGLGPRALLRSNPTRLRGGVDEALQQALDELAPALAPQAIQAHLGPAQLGRAHDHWCRWC